MGRIAQEIPLLLLLVGLGLIFFADGKPLTLLGMGLILAGGALAAAKSKGK